MALTQQQVENIQIDYGLVFVNYGETDQKQLGPTRGGGEFVVTKNIRDIEFDERKGKTKGIQVVDSIDAQLTVTHLDASLETLQLAMPYAKLDELGKKISCGAGALGVIPDEAYLKNITMFAKVIGGNYKKITLYNAMSEADFTLTAAPKGEGEMPLEVYAHWDAYDDTALLYEIEDVPSIATGDVEPPTVVTVPADEAASVEVTSSLTATFSEDIQERDISDSNFTLIKATDGTVVDGALSYSSATKTATFTPAVALDASTAYIWMIANIRDKAGNKMAKTVVNFTTAV
ncbi:Ig-like domain-containing domain [Candidatus Darwinibacter acetoxidans]